MFKDKIVALLAEADNDVLCQFFNSEVGNESEWDYEEVKTFRKLLKDEKITFEHVDNYGGEDQGSEYWSVYSFTDGMEIVFIKFDGSYASFCGSEFDNFYEVQPIEKTITVFKKK